MLVRILFAPHLPSPTSDSKQEIKSSTLVLRPDIMNNLLLSHHTVNVDHTQVESIVTDP
ncbi:hypothetical protein RchiOBHm_Chr2g0150931 [Rosa chinensis]|uniref:Uncharacterized protein n=1 Tax=Rosa chinensis TaxID=74649 RepID=A0A2P6S005_ROSCH|nr:hypothetical protein RchiOBHm_Chr2g0150931 [Rosa chinensis]